MVETATLTPYRGGMAATVTNIYRYPVKGLSAEPLDRVELAPGDGVPHDRRFALAHGTTRFNPEQPEWLPKTNFLMLMRNERLAHLRSRFDDMTGMLSLEHDGKIVLRSNILEPAGRMIVEQFFAAFMGPGMPWSTQAGRRERPHVLRLRAQGRVADRPCQYL